MVKRNCIAVIRAAGGLGQGGRACWEGVHGQVGWWTSPTRDKLLTLEPQDAPSMVGAYIMAELWPGWALLLAWGPDTDPPAGPPDVLCPGWVCLVWGIDVDSLPST